ncbi:MAG: Crp/Fnr family transcriptional regulator [Pseudomonadota bacterium]
MASEKRARLKRGDFLFAAGDQQTDIYAVKAGFLKTCMQLADGQNKIVGFHAMGDALGLGSLGNGAHTTDAIALNDCEVCLIPIGRFEKLLEHPAESVHVRQLLAREITRIEAHSAAVSSLSAKQLVARFLLDISDRWEERGYSKNEFVLFMSRKEIGSFLGLTFETVSRTLSYFQSKKWITVHDKNLLILDMAALQSQLESTAFGHVPLR